ncbi:MAG: RimJ/RimL family protein N-acetyltransferase [Lentisphaeria bacterium]|jgi:RimJ/RimL family protein N-acetyltransferase
MCNVYKFIANGQLAEIGILMGQYFEGLGYGA